MPRRKKRVTRRRKRPVRRKVSRKRTARRVGVIKAKLSGVGLAGLNLGGRVMYCERKAGKKVCFPRQYVKNIKRTTRNGKTILTAEVAHAGREFMQGHGKGGTHVMKVSKAKGRRKGGPAWAKNEMKRVAKKCAAAGKKPGTKAWGSCIRTNFKKKR